MERRDFLKSAAAGLGATAGAAVAAQPKEGGAHKEKAHAEGASIPRPGSERNRIRPPSAGTC